MSNYNIILGIYKCKNLCDKVLFPNLHVEFVMIQ